MICPKTGTGGALTHPATSLSTICRCGCGGGGWGGGGGGGCLISDAAVPAGDGKDDTQAGVGGLLAAALVQLACAALWQPPPGSSKGGSSGARTDAAGGASQQAQVATRPDPTHPATSLSTICRYVIGGGGVEGRRRAAEAALAACRFVI